MAGTLPGLPDGVRHVLAVAAHPDDASCGPGDLLSLLSDGVALPAARRCQFFLKTVTARLVQALSLAATAPVVSSTFVQVPGGSVTL